MSCIRWEGPFLKNSMSTKIDKGEKIPEKFDDNVVLFLCRGKDRKQVRFRKRDAVPKFKHEVLLIAFSQPENHFYIYHKLLHLHFVFVRLISYTNSEINFLLMLFTVCWSTVCWSSGEILKMIKRCSCQKTIKWMKDNFRVVIETRSSCQDCLLKILFSQVLLRLVTIFCFYQVSCSIISACLRKWI